jgi:hypothetical protein
VNVSRHRERGDMNYFSDATLSDIDDGPFRTACARPRAAGDL